MSKNLQPISFLAFCVIASSLTIGMTSIGMAQTTAGQDVHQAGQDTKDAAKDTGSGVKKGTTKAYDATKHGTTKTVDKTKEGTTKGFDKTKEGTTKAFDKSKEGVEHVVNPRGLQASKEKDAINENYQHAHDTTVEMAQRMKDSSSK